MQVFFGLKGKRREYVREGEAWTHIPFGGFAVEVMNAFIDEDAERIKQLTGKEEEKEAVAAAWPVLALGIAIRKGFTAGVLEKKIQLPQKGPAAYAVELFSGQDDALWQAWPKLWPFCKGRQFGWLVNGTILEVAITEMVLAFMGGLKPFRVCKQCRRAYQGEGCPNCKEVKQKKGTFLTLLRQHKARAGERERRLQKRLDKLNGREEKARSELQQAIEEIQYGIGEIEKLQKKLQKKPLTREIVNEYAEICKGCGLPTRWVKKYL